MKHFKVTVMRERHYIESCEVEVCAADEIEATDKALAEAEEDGDWEWYESFDADDGDTSVEGIEEIKTDEEEHDFCYTTDVASWVDRPTPAPVIDYRALAIEIERKETGPKRGEMPVDR